VYREAKKERAQKGTYRTEGVSFHENGRRVLGRKGYRDLTGKRPIHKGIPPPPGKPLNLWGKDPKFLHPNTPKTVLLFFFFFYLCTPKTRWFSPKPTGETPGEQVGKPIGVCENFGILEGREEGGTGDRDSPPSMGRTGKLISSGRSRGGRKTGGIGEEEKAKNARPVQCTVFRRGWKNWKTGTKVKGERILGAILGQGGG